MRPAGRRVGRGRAVGRGDGGVSRPARSSSSRRTTCAAGRPRGRAAGCGCRCNPLSQADGDRRGPRRPAHVPASTRSGEHYDAARVDALLDAGPQMVAFFEQNTALQFVSGTRIADIQETLPGAGTGGRSVAPEAVQRPRARRELLRQAATAQVRDLVPRHGHHGRPRPAGVPARHAVAEVRSSTRAGASVRHVFDLATQRQGMQLVNGPALGRPADEVRRRPRRRAMGVVAGDAPADRRRRRTRRGGRHAGRRGDDPRQARRRAGRRRIPARRRRAGARAVRRARPTGSEALDAAAGGVHGDGIAPRRSRPAASCRPQRRLAGGVVPGFARARTAAAASASTRTSSTAASPA